MLLRKKLIPNCRNIIKRYCHHDFEEIKRNSILTLKLNDKNLIKNEIEHLNLEIIRLKNSLQEQNIKIDQFNSDITSLENKIYFGSLAVVVVSGFTLLSVAN